MFKLFYVMKNNALESKSKPTAGPVEKSQPGLAVTQPECPEPEAFLTEAKKESKRKLLADHERTIVTLRDKRGSRSVKLLNGLINGELKPITARCTAYIWVRFL